MYHEDMDFSIKQRTRVRYYTFGGIMRVRGAAEFRFIIGTFVTCCTVR